MPQALDHVFHAMREEHARTSEEIFTDMVHAINFLFGDVPDSLALPEPLSHKVQSCDVAQKLSEHYEKLISDSENVIRGKLKEKENAAKALTFILEGLVGAPFESATASRIDGLDGSICKSALTVAFELLKVVNVRLHVADHYEKQRGIRIDYLQTQLIALEKLARELGVRVDDSEGCAPGCAVIAEKLADRVQKAEEALAASDQLLKDTSRKSRQLQAELRSERESAQRTAKEVLSASATLTKLAESVGETSASATCGKPSKGKSGPTHSDPVVQLKRSVDALSKKLERQQQAAQRDKAASPSGPSAQEVEAMRKQITELTEKTTVKEDQLSRLRDSYSCVLQERDKAKDTADSLTKQLAKLRAEKRDDAPKKRCK